MRKTFPFSSLFRLPMPPPPQQPTRRNMCPGRRRCLLPSPRFFYFSSSSSSSFRLVPLFHRRLSMAAPDGSSFPFPPLTASILFSLLFLSSFPFTSTSLTTCVSGSMCCPIYCKKIKLCTISYQKVSNKEAENGRLSLLAVQRCGESHTRYSSPVLSLGAPSFFPRAPAIPTGPRTDSLPSAESPSPPPPCLPQTKQHATIPPP